MTSSSALRALRVGSNFRRRIGFTLAFAGTVFAADSSSPTSSPSRETAPSSEAASATPASTSTDPLAQLAEGRALLGQGKFAEAEALLRAAAEAFTRDASHRRELGLAQRERAFALGFLNRLGEAEELFPLALANLEASAGPNDPETLTCAMHFASLYAYTGRAELAEPRLRRVVVAQAAAGIKSPESVDALAGLGSALAQLGQLAEAEAMQRRALAIAEETSGPESPATGAVLNHLAATLRQQGRHAEALPFAERTLRLREKFFPPEHPNVILQRGNHSVLLGEVGRFDEAEAMLRPLLNWAAENKGRDSAYYAYYPRTLARIFHQAGRDAEAVTLAEESRGIFERALASGKREYETDAAAELGRTYALLGRIYCALDRRDDARAVIAAARPGTLADFRRTLSYTSEAQRLAFLRASSAFDLAATLGDAAELARDSVRLRGVVFESVVEDLALARATGDPAIAALAARHRTALRNRSAGDPANLAAGQLGELEEIERELAQKGQTAGAARRALDTDIATVRHALQPDEALVEFLRYRHFLPRSKSEPRFGALILLRDEAPRWVALGPSRAIDEAVARYQQLMRDGGDAAWLDEVHARVIAPVLAALPANVAKLRLSPEGSLHGVSFAAVPSPAGEFPGTRFEITYVDSGRDLLPRAAARRSEQFAIVAAPEFGTATALAAVERVSDRDDLVRGLTLRPLPGAEAEAGQLAKLAVAANRPVAQFTGADATEARLEALHSPRWLHLATHGFFLPDVPGDARHSPMRRAGLALAKARGTLAAWRDGREPDPAHDGILTAAEACALDLAGTELVVLSACESGAGVASAGEGLLGLKRGFARAGARNLLLALWEVPDAATPEIMTDFYGALLKETPPPTAWAATQRTWLQRVAAKDGRVAAARTIGPWVLNERR